MIDKLIVILPAIDSPHFIIEGQTVTLQDAQTFINNRPFILLLPSHVISHFQINIPSQNKQHCLQAVPHLLEDKVSDDIESLHFAIADEFENAKCHVAIIQHQLMTRVTNLLKEHQLYPSKILADIYQLPYLEEQWTLIQQNDFVLIRQEKFSGFSCHINDFPVLIKLAFEQALNKPKAMITFTKELISLCDNEIPIQQAVVEYTPNIDQGINLLTTPYKLKKKNQQQHWRILLISSCLLLATFMIGKTAQAIYLKNRIAWQQQQIAKLYYQLFPQATAVVSPKFRISEKLKALSNGNELNEALFDRLSIIALALKSAPEVTLTTLNFNQSEIKLTLTTTSIDHFNHFVQQLKKYHITFKQQITDTKQAINANIRITL